MRVWKDLKVGGAEGIRTPDPHNAIVAFLWIFPSKYGHTNLGALFGARFFPCFLAPNGVQWAPWWAPSSPARPEANVPHRRRPDQRRRQGFAKEGRGQG
jgi:hypothetical protein